MIELLVFGALAFAAVLVISVVGAVIGALVLGAGLLLLLTPLMPLVVIAALIWLVLRARPRTATL